MVHRYRAPSLQQPLQPRHCIVLINALNEIHGFANHAVRPRSFEAPSSILPASSQLPLHCAETPSVARSLSEVH